MASHHFAGATLSDVLRGPERNPQDRSTFISVTFLSFVLLFRGPFASPSGLFVPGLPVPANQNRKSACDLRKRRLCPFPPAVRRVRTGVSCGGVDREEP